MRVLSDGRILVAGTVIESFEDYFPRCCLQARMGFPRIALARLLDSGLPDLTFAGGGFATTSIGLGSFAEALAIDPDGKILIAGGNQVMPQYIPDPAGGWTSKTSPGLFRLQGGADAPHREQRESLAVEYFHSGFGHYFVTATPKEIAALDMSLRSSAWQRTGKQFKVWSEAAPDLAPNCRFFSDQTFAPKSSHFYTVYVEECNSVLRSRAWNFEGEAFELALPVQTDKTTCPDGTTALYRLYNAGRGGAPNHRYTTESATVDAMVAEGWLTEGDDETRIYACAVRP